MYSWCLVPVILALRRLRGKDCCECEASLNCIVTSSFKNKTRKKANRGTHRGTVVWRDREKGTTQKERELECILSFLLLPHSCDEQQEQIQSRKERVCFSLQIMVQHQEKALETGSWSSHHRCYTAYCLDLKVHGQLPFLSSPGPLTQGWRCAQWAEPSDIN